MTTSLSTGWGEGQWQCPGIARLLATHPHYSPRSEVGIGEEEVPGLAPKLLVWVTRDMGKLLSLKTNGC